MAKFNDKISTILNSQLPEFVVADHPKFAQFLKTYYQLLESAELSIDTIEGTDGILLQSETGQTANLVLNSSRKDTARTLLDAGDKILLEESTYGKFTRGETVTGQTSKATAIVLVEDIDNNRLIITAQDKFINNEIIVGSSSGAQANITNYKPNPVNNIVDLVNFRDPDGVVSQFLKNMRDEFLTTLPENLASGIRTYSNETQGTINYTTGQITLNSLNIASISNIRGATSTVVELTVTPNSNDVAPVRDQIVEIDITNSTINVTADTFVGGSADAGVGYTTTSSY